MKRIVFLLLIATGSSLGAQSSRVRLSHDSIGALPLALPLRELAQRVQGGARREVWRGYETGYPALVFTIGGLRVWAVQEREPAEGSDTLPDLDYARPADFFAIEGGSGVLPGGGRTGSRWAQLRRTLGPVLVYAETGPIHVRPCRYDWLVVGFENRRAVKSRPDGTADPAVIPARTVPEYVHIIRKEQSPAVHPRCRAG